MDITNFHGLASILREEAGTPSGGTGDGGSTAVATTGGTDLATTGGGEGEGAEGADAAALATTSADSQSVYEGGKLSQGAAKTFRELETANPNARKVLTMAQRAMGAWSKVTAMLGPKPIEAINGLRKFYKEVGGEKGLAELRESIQDMQKSDELYGKSDPRLLDMMTEAAAAKQAYVRLWPHSVQKMYDLSPIAYRKWAGLQTLHSIEKSNVTIQIGGKAVTEPLDLAFRLRRVFGMLPLGVDPATQRLAGGALTPDQAQQLSIDLSFLWAWMDQLKEMAAATPEDLTPPKEDTSAARIAEIEKEADKNLQEAWQAKRDAICNNILDDEVRKQTRGMNLSSVIILDITARARKSVNDTRKAQPDNLTKVGGFKAVKNLAGYVAYNKAIFESNAPEAVEKAVALYSKKSSRRAPQAAQTIPASQATTSTTAATPAATQGQIVRLNPTQAQQLGGKPGITRWMKPFIAGKGTTMAMIMKGQYVLKAGNPAGLPEWTVVQL